MGPNVRKLIARRAATLIVPAGGGLGSVINAMRAPDTIIAATRNATEFVKAAIRIVKTAPDNPFGDDDEAIAAEILRKGDERSRRR